MKYRLELNDGHVFIAKSKAGLVRLMKKKWVGRDMTKIEYKNEVAKRLFEMHGKIINKDKFIDSLVEEHLAVLTEIELN